MSDFQIKSKDECRWDFVSLGEVLLRFDASDERIHNARSFRVWDGGGEYNVAKNLSRTFRQKTAVITVLADNAIGRLAEDFILQGGVDSSQIVWREADRTRNGIYFIERGFGNRPPSSCFDRGNTAISQLKVGEIDWQKIFGADSAARWFHTGGIFTGLSEATPEVALEAMKVARKNRAIVSYDLNYRDSQWKMRGGKTEANRMTQELLPFVDIVFGIPDFLPNFAEFDAEEFRVAAENLQSEFPNLKIIAVTLREIISASQHNFSAASFANGKVCKAREYKNTLVLDRVGSGDAFAAGLIYGLLNEREISDSLSYGVANAVLTMTTPGDNSMATMGEIEQLIKGVDASAIR